MRVLIGCESSGIVRRAFAALGRAFICMAYCRFIRPILSAAEWPACIECRQGRNDGESEAAHSRGLHQPWLINGVGRGRIMKTHNTPLTLADIEDSIYAIKAYQHNNTRHPGLSARQRWHRLSKDIARIRLRKQAP